MVRALGALALALLLACDQAAPDPPQPAAISVTPPRTDLTALEETVRLTATVQDQNGQPMPSAAVTWTSGTAAVATVDGSGVVTAAANGVATITATAGTVSATATVTVTQAVATVAVTPPIATVVEADTLRLSAVAADANGHEVSGTLVTWASADTLVAVVNAFGLVTGVAAGVAVVEGSTASGVTGRTEIEVVPPVPSAVAVSPDTVALGALGATAVLTAAVSDQAGRLMEGAAVSWTSGDTAVAVADSAGVATAVAEGATAITAKAGAASGSAVVTVAQVVGSVAVTPAADTLELGDTLRLSAEAFDGNGHRVAGARFEWRSSDTAVARVDQAGLMRGSGEGTVAITATAGDASAEAEISVVNPDRAALVALYEATDGPNWTRRDNWLTDAPLGTWHGVTVNEEGRVTYLGFLSNGLMGEIPPELGDLTSLETLELRNNALTGAIPPALGDLTALGGLYLDDNELTGPIPAELGNLTALQWLLLQGNALTGEIPAELGNLTRLEWLWLHGNGLTGKIPPELGNLTALETLHLWRNSLTGEIPTELGSLTALETLDLSGNALTGPIPSRFLELTALREFNIDATGLCLPGTGAFLRWREQLTSFGGEGAWCNEADRSALAALHDATGGANWTHSQGWLEDGPVLSGWHGVTTDSLGRVAGLSLPANNLAGRITPVGTLPGLRILDVGDNPHLQGPLPLSLTRAPLDTLRFAGTGLCSLPGTRDWLESIPVAQGTGETCAPLSDRDVLVTLYHATGGADWDSQGNWLTDAPLGDWHGVVVNEEGRVVVLLLLLNALIGQIPPELGNLTALEWLNLANNALTGEIPAELEHLTALERVDLHDNALAGPIPPELGSLTALEELELHSNALTGPIPPELGNLTALETLNLSGNDLTGSIPPELRNMAALDRLSLGFNDLTGPIPPELENLTALRSLDLRSNALTGEIPPALGNLTALVALRLNNNALTGSIPPELGNLKALVLLDLFTNNLTGPIPPELGNLTALRWLHLWRNSLTGSIPPEMGNLAALRTLELSNNALDGEIPAELGDLSALTGLWLHGNDLTGPIPPELGNLIRLEKLELYDNGRLSGSLPLTLTALRRLGQLVTSNTGLCAPADPGFQRWVSTIVRYRVRQCSTTVAYLVQAVQSRDYPVPLVAGRDALLRVFPTSPSEAAFPVPPVRATLYSGGRKLYSVDIPSKPGPLPAEIDEGNLAVSANAEIAGYLVQPGLELVVEIDPEGTLDSNVSVTKRIPESGRLTLDVRTMPTFQLTLIPFLSENAPDSSVLSITRAMSNDPFTNTLLGKTRTLLPVGDMDVVLHDPVVTSSTASGSILRHTELIRVLETGPGYYLGTMSGPVADYLGRAYLHGRSSFAVVDRGDWSELVIAHELGHNMSLQHPPGCAAGGPDLAFPHPGGRIGTWGYDFRFGGRLVAPNTGDLMSYCQHDWISDYHFTNALHHRVRAETSSNSVRALLLWGGESESGGLHLDPAFVLDAMPVLPDSTGGYTLEGRDAGGRVLFSLPFAMPEIADGDEAAGGFVYTLPVQPGWAALASVTLTAPDGRTATLDTSTDRPMTILRDSRTGRVRAFLDGVSAAVQADGGGEDLAARLGAVAITSAGIPSRDAWRR